MADSNRHPGRAAQATRAARIGCTVDELVEQQRAGREWCADCQGVKERARKARAKARRAAA